jgi:hypothetical protein
VKGLAGFLGVFEENRALYQTQDQQVQREWIFTVSLITLCEALDDGWEM